MSLARLAWLSSPPRSRMRPSRQSTAVDAPVPVSANPTTSPRTLTAVADAAPPAEVGDGTRAAPPDRVRESAGVPVGGTGDLPGVVDRVGLAGSAARQGTEVGRHAIDPFERMVLESAGREEADDLPGVVDVS